MEKPQSQKKTPEDLKAFLPSKTESTKGLSAEEKVKEQNRIRQLAFKIRQIMPKDQRTYSLVAAHLVKNAYRYYKDEEKMEIKKTESEVEYNEDPCVQVNRKLTAIRTLKRHNRIREQQKLVLELKEYIPKIVPKGKKEVGSYRDIATVSGVPLKTVYSWCSPPKEREHKGTSRAKLKKEEFLNFLMQDTITFSDPSKRYCGKRFMLHTWNEVYQRYLQQPEFHQNGILSRTTMRMYKPKFILLTGSTPLSQCLCDHCQNCELLRKSLVAIGVKGLPATKYDCVDSTLCLLRNGQFGTNYSFAPSECITRNCDHCGTDKLKETINALNKDILQLNKTVVWHQWRSVEGKSCPQKVEIKRPLKNAVNQFMDILHDISEHLFRANWHRNVFQYIQRNLMLGYVLQVMDFAMNFRNWYQDEVQSAYWCGTQTSIHATMNFFKCPREGCTEIVTLALVHISDDLKHDSFLSRAAQNMALKFLVNAGIPLELIIQFCDNCAAQYKSRRPFVELARIAVEIIRVYFGEKHGKSHADSLFGRLKSWMTFKIKARHCVIKDAKDFYNACCEMYQTPRLENCCQHYRVEFEFIRPSDVRRKQDSDLDRAVPKTQEIYSVRNTDQPLQLKVRAVPCLCPPCINEEGVCLNSDYTDPWRIVDLIPEKGANLRKYAKRKRPDEHLRTRHEERIISNSPTEEIDNTDPESDGELPDIQINVDWNALKKRNVQRNQKERKKEQKKEKIL